MACKVCSTSTKQQKIGQCKSTAPDLADIDDNLQDALDQNGHADCNTSTRYHLAQNRTGSISLAMFHSWLEPISRSSAWDGLSSRAAEVTVVDAEFLSLGVPGFCDGFAVIVRLVGALSIQADLLRSSGRAMMAALLTGAGYISQYRFE